MSEFFTLEQLGEIGRYNLIDGYGFNIYQNGSGLFDNITDSTYGSKSSFYWNGATKYLIIEIIDSKVDIYRSPCNGYTASAVHNKPLTISKLIDSQYVDITSEVEQAEIDLTIQPNMFQKFITNLSAGTYKFTCSDYRMDSEWFIQNKVEILFPNNSITLRNGTIIINHDLTLIGSMINLEKVVNKIYKNDEISELYKKDIIITNGGV